MFPNLEADFFFVKQQIVVQSISLSLLLIYTLHRYVIDINARYSYIHMNLRVEKYYVCDITRYLYFRSFKRFVKYVCTHFTVVNALKNTYMFTYNLNVFCAINIFLFTLNKKKTLVLSMFHLECCLKI